MNSLRHLASQVKRTQCRAIHSAIQKFIDIAPEVGHALQTNAPVVALESALITNGMPYPTNQQTAQSAEAIVRAHGAIPATIALIDGRFKVGLSEAQLEQLSNSQQERVKLSRRDLSTSIALRKTGGRS